MFDYLTYRVFSEFGYYRMLNSFRGALAYDRVAVLTCRSRLSNGLIFHGGLCRLTNGVVVSTRSSLCVEVLFRYFLRVVYYRLYSPTLAINFMGCLRVAIFRDIFGSLFCRIRVIV